MTESESYATPEATWAAIRSAAQNGAAVVGVQRATLQQLLLFDRLLARVFDGDARFVLKGGTRMLAFIPAPVRPWTSIWRPLRRASTMRSMISTSCWIVTSGTGSASSGSVAPQAPGALTSRM